MPKRETSYLGTLVRPARERMGWTQQQIADRLGIDKGYISAIEIGARRWPREHIEALAEELGLDLVEMAIAAGVLPEKVRKRRTLVETFPIGDPREELFLLLHNADHGRRQAVLEYARFLASIQEKAAPARIDEKGKRRVS